MWRVFCYSGSYWVCGIEGVARPLGASFSSICFVTEQNGRSQSFVFFFGDLTPRLAFMQNEAPEALDYGTGIMLGLQ
jgi:hypothetical protein